MSELTLVVSDAGRAAIVNAENNGTAPVLVAGFGVTDQAFTAATDTAELPGEIKRLTTFAGDAVAADTIHVTIRDDTSDVYTIRGFAFYLDDGTLFASYGQADPIGEKSAQSMFLLALDAIFADIDATSLTFGDTDFLLSQATTERQGIVELATDAEAIAGSDPARAITPKAFKAALDSRFGVGAPSGFIKGLLTAASAAVLRAALAIKGAALYDAGTGNGLDADLLDGQHGSYYQAWANLTGVPASFPPSAHSHSASDIVSGTLAVAHGGTGRVTLTAGSYLVGNDTGGVTLYTAAQVLADIGAAKASHTHSWSQILDPPATATSWPTWAQVSQKPTFGTASAKAVEDFASYQDGVLARSAVQPNTSPVLSGVAVEGPSGSTRSVFWKSGDANRWVMYANTSAETGNNAGSNLSIGRYDDNGGGLDVVVTFGRADKSSYFAGNVTVNGNVSAPTISAGTGTFSNSVAFGSGVTFGNKLASSATDLSKHLALWGATYGISVTGNTVNIVANGSLAAKFTSSGVTSVGFNSDASSRTVKHDIAPCRYGLVEFLQIPWVEFRYNESITKDGRLRFGAIVEDVEPVAPELVIHRKGQVPTFEYDQFIPVIGRAMQEYIACADARAEALQSRIAEMSRNMASMADRLAALESRG